MTHVNMFVHNSAFQRYRTTMTVHACSSSLGLPWPGKARKPDAFFTSPPQLHRLSGQVVVRDSCNRAFGDVELMYGLVKQPARQDLCQLQAQQHLSDLQEKPNMTCPVASCTVGDRPL